MVLWGIIIKNISDALLLSFKLVNLTCLQDSGCLKNPDTFTFFSWLAIDNVSNSICDCKNMSIAFSFSICQKQEKGLMSQNKNKKIFFEENGDIRQFS